MSHGVNYRSRLAHYDCAREQERSGGTHVSDSGENYIDFLRVPPHKYVSLPVELWERLGGCAAEQWVYAGYMRVWRGYMRARRVYASLEGLYANCREGGG